VRDARRHEGKMAVMWNCRNDRGIRLQLTQLGTRKPGFNARERAIRRRARQRPIAQYSVHALRGALQHQPAASRRRIAMIAI
jgi:hypothetical protein